MLEKPIYHFEDTTSTGIDSVPIGSLVMIRDSDGVETPRMLIRVGIGSYSPANTIEGFLDSYDYRDAFQPDEAQKPTELNFTAVSNQTEFMVDHDTTKHIDVFSNGIKLSPDKYVITNAEMVVLNTPANEGDWIQTSSYSYVPEPGAWDYRTAVELSAVDKGQDMNSLLFSANGDVLYTSHGDAYFRKWNLSTPWDITTMTGGNTITIPDVGSTTPIIKGAYFSPSGTMLFVTTAFNPADQARYDLSTPWDISTATYTHKCETAGYGEDIQLSTDGTKLYVCDAKNDSIREYPLGTAWDLTTMGTSTASLNTGVTPRGLFMRKQGTKLYSSASTYTKQYKLGTAWDLSTASFEYNMNAGFSSTYDSFISSDGLNGYIVDHNTGVVKHYSLGV